MRPTRQLSPVDLNLTTCVAHSFESNSVLGQHFFIVSLAANKRLVESLAPDSMLLSNT
jgi:hypothetical protein